MVTYYKPLLLSGSNWCLYLLCHLIQSINFSCSSNSPSSCIFRRKLIETGTTPEDETGHPHPLASGCSESVSQWFERDPVGSRAQRKEGPQWSDRRVFIDLSSPLVADALCSKTLASWPPHQIVDITGLPGKVATRASLLLFLLIGIHSGWYLLVTP